MNRFSKINISPLLLNFNKNKSFKVSSQLHKCFINNSNSNISRCSINNSNNFFKINNNNNNIRLYSTSQQQQTPKQEEKPEQQLQNFDPQPGYSQPNLKSDLSKYKTNIKVSDLNPEHLIYQSGKENLLKFLSPSLTFQAAIAVFAPLFALYNNIDKKAVFFLSVVALWGISFKFIGEKLGSCFAMRVYREPGSDNIKLVHINPRIQVLEIPLADIQQSKLTNAKTPYVLLDNGSIFFFENDGILHNEEEFNFILSGEVNKEKNKILEQEEYEKFFKESNTEDLEHANKVLDFELELLNKQLEEEAEKEKLNKETENEKKQQ